MKDVKEKAAVYSSSINYLKLNCSNLKNVRRLWYLFHNFDMVLLNKAVKDRNIRIKSLLQVLFREKDFLVQDAEIYKNFQIDIYWETFLKYQWFKSYYQKKYSCQS